MKLHKYSLILAVTLTMLACGHKKSNSSSAISSAPTPVSFHNVKDCPNMNGAWLQDVANVGGSTSLIKVDFSVRQSDLNIVFNRLSAEGEDWVVDGIQHKYDSGKSVMAYCQNKTITVEIWNADTTFEVLSFTGDIGSAAPAPTDKIKGVDLNFKGVADQDTINALLQANQPQVTFDRSTELPRPVQIR